MWQRISLVMFLGYALIWTALLLVPDISILFIPSDLPDQIGRAGSPLDKVVHASGYFVLTALAVAAFSRRARGVPLGWLYAGAAVHGVATEIGQYFIPERAADPLDWCADVSGATIAILVVTAFRRLRVREANRRPAHERL